MKLGTYQCYYAKVICNMRCKREIVQSWDEGKINLTETLRGKKARYVQTQQFQFSYLK